MALNLDTSVKLGLILYLPEHPYPVSQLRELLTTLAMEAGDVVSRETLNKLLECHNTYLRIRSERLFREATYIPKINSAA